MSESKYYPCTQPTGPGGTPVVVSGGEVQTGDLILLGQVAGLADDRALAELFRIPPMPESFVPTRFILPYDTNIPFFAAGTIIPSGLSDASVTVQPFRMVVGPRVVNLTDPVAWWKDARSAAFTIENTKLTLAPNSSGSTLWDLVYAQLTLDVPGNARTRRVKDPNQGNVTVQQIFQTLETTVTVGVIAGSVADTIPTLPQDSTGAIYYAPLAAIRKADGFSGTHAIATTDIRDQAQCAPLARSTGSVPLRPADGNNDGAGTYAIQSPALHQSWGASGRPSTFLPSSLVGGEQLLVEVDLVDSSHPSHRDGDVVDQSVDWRNRFFKIDIQVAKSSIGALANDPAGASGNRVPLGTVVPGDPSTAVLIAEARLGNTFSADAFFAANQATIWTGNNAQYASFFASGVYLGFYVDMTTGQLKIAISGTAPTVRVFAWIVATAQFPNP